MFHTVGCFLYTFGLQKKIMHPNNWSFRYLRSFPISITMLIFIPVGFLCRSYYDIIVRVGRLIRWYFFKLIFIKGKGNLDPGDVSVLIRSN